MNSIFFFYVRSLPVTTMILAAFLLMRFLLRRESRRSTNILWLFLLIRLLVPLTVTGNFGILPETAVLSGMEPAEFVSFAKVSEANEAVWSGTSGTLQDEPIETVSSRSDILMTVLPIVWAGGIGEILLVNGVGLVNLLKKRRQARCLDETSRVYEWQDHTDACVLGIIHPTVYVPAGLDEETLAIVIKHEKTHIRRKDHLILLVAFFGLCLYWYHPLYWIAYTWIRRDLETACDEQVLAHAEASEKKAYSRALVLLAAKQSPRFLPINSFGKGDLKMRVKRIGEGHKHKKVLAIVLGIVCVLAIGIAAFLNASPDYSELSAQFAQREFGAYMPEICYADKDIVVFYDPYGIYVYRLDKEQLSGYASFEGTEICGFQGSETYGVCVSADSSSVYLYPNAPLETSVYIYDIKRDKLIQTEKTISELDTRRAPAEYYDEIIKFEAPQPNGYIFPYQLDGYCYFGLEGDAADYSSLRLVTGRFLGEYVIKKDQKVYTVFQ